MSVVHRIKHSSVVQPMIHSPAFIFVTLLSFVLFLFQCLQSAVDLSFQRAAIDSGELWRLLTGGLVHANWQHYLLNQGALLLLIVCFPFRQTIYHGLLGTCLLTIAINLCIYITLPHTTYYYGFSGTLYGLFVWSCCTELANRTNRLVAGITLVYIAGKLGHDIWIPDSLSSAILHMPVFWPAHCFGILGGCILFSGAQIKKYLF